MNSFASPETFSDAVQAAFASVSEPGRRAGDLPQDERDALCRAARAARAAQRAVCEVSTGSEEKDEGDEDPPFIFPRDVTRLVDEISTETDRAAARSGPELALQNRMIKAGRAFARRAAQESGAEVSDDDEEEEEEDDEEREQREGDGAGGDDEGDGEEATRRAHDPVGGLVRLFKDRKVVVQGFASGSREFFEEATGRPPRDDAELEGATRSASTLLPVLMLLGTATSGLAGLAPAILGLARTH